jgi:hypothetical protein
VNICAVCRVRNSDAATECRSCGNPLDARRTESKPPPAETRQRSSAERLAEELEERRRAEQAEAERRAAEEIVAKERAAEVAAAERRAAEESAGERLAGEDAGGVDVPLLAEPIPETTGNERAHVVGTLDVGAFLLRLTPSVGPLVEHLPPRAKPVFRLVDPPPVLRPRRRNVTGRGAELTAARALLARRSARAVLFAGPHGSGKTSLLVELAHDDNVLPLYPDGIFYVRGGRRTPDDVLQFVFHELFASAHPLRPTNEQLQAVLAGKRVLLLLDDFDGDANALVALARSLPQGGVVAAARKAVSGDAYDAIPLGALSDAAARELLGLTVGRQMTSLEAGGADALCASLDGNPLRIVQIGALARIAQRSFLSIADGIGTHPSAQDLERYLVAPLNAAEREVLGAASAFGGAPFDAALLAQIANVAEIEMILERLCRRKIVARTAGLYQVQLRAYVVDPVETKTWIAKTTTFLNDWLNEPEIDARAVIERVEPFFHALGNAEQAAEFVDERALIGACSVFSEVCVLCSQWGLALSAIDVTIGVAKRSADRDAEARSYDLKGTIFLLLGNADEARFWLALARDIYRETQPHAAQAVAANFHTVTGRELPAADAETETINLAEREQKPPVETTAAQPLPDRSSAISGAAIGERRAEGRSSRAGWRIPLAVVALIVVAVAAAFALRPSVEIYRNADGELCHKIGRAIRADYITSSGPHPVGAEECLSKVSPYVTASSWIAVVAYGPFGLQTVSDQFLVSPPAGAPSSSPPSSALTVASPARAAQAVSKPSPSPTLARSLAAASRSSPSPTSERSPTFAPSPTPAPSTSPTSSPKRSPTPAPLPSPSPTSAPKPSPTPAPTVAAVSTPPATLVTQVGNVVWTAARTIDIGGLPFDVPPSAEVVVVTPDGKRPIKVTEIPPGARVSVSYAARGQEARVVKAVRVLSLRSEPPVASKPTPTPLQRSAQAVNESASLKTIQSPVRVFIQTVDARIVTAVDGGGGASAGACGPDTVALDTSATTVGPYQKFTLLSLGDQQYALRTAGGQYVSAVSAQAGLTTAAQKSPLHLDAHRVDRDENFTLVPAGDSVAIQTPDGVHYVSAVGGGGCAGSESLPFRTSAQTIGDAETFSIVPLAGQKQEL